MRKSIHAPTAFALAQRPNGVSGAELAVAGDLGRDIAGAILRWMLASGPWVRPRVCRNEFQRGYWDAYTPRSSIWSATAPQPSEAF